MAPFQSLLFHLSNVTQGPPASRQQDRAPCSQAHALASSKVFPKLCLFPLPLARRPVYLTITPAYLHIMSAPVYWPVSPVRAEAPQRQEPFALQVPGTDLPLRR